MKMKVLLLICIAFYSAPGMVTAQEGTPSGAMSYRYPIALPPGTNGMTPNLSLSYNSQKGNGMLGMGFSLSGLSAITRDKSYPVNFDENDHYRLDGQRLVKFDDGYYHTEREDFTRIEEKNLNSAVSQWIVTLKNGTRMYYGYDDDEHTELSDGHIAAVGKNGKALLWALYKVEDVHGNYYTIDYEEDTANGDYYPVKITYTKNRGIYACHKIKFSYEDRTDHYPVYIPTRYEMDKRLAWITVNSNDTLVRSYQIEYEYSSSTNRSRIVKIHQYGTDGPAPPSTDANGFTHSFESGIPPVVFEWSEIEGNGYETNWEEVLPGTTITGEKHRFWFSDINVDGKADFIWMDDQVNIKIKYYKDAPFTTDWDYISPNNFATYVHDSNRVWLTDVDGDGRVDLLMRDSGNNLNLHLSSVLGFASKPNVWSEYLGTGTWYLWQNNRFFFEDVSGDGRNDLMIRDSGNNLNLSLSEGTGFIINVYSIYLGTGTYLENEKNHIWFEDINGNGKADRLIRDSGNNLNLSLSNGTGFIENVSSQYLGTGTYLNNENNRMWFQDINGDGKNDVVIRDSGNNISYGLSDGNRFVAENTVSTPISPGRTFTENNCIWFGDVNGDGLPDVAIRDNGNTAYWFGINTGNGFIMESFNIDTSNGQEDAKVLFADINGDGRTEIIEEYRSENGIKLSVLFSKGPSPDLLTKITNPMGGTSEIEYTPAPQVEGTIDSSDSEYPIKANTSARQLITGITVKESADATGYSTTYNYSNGKVMTGFKEDRKNLGYETVTKTNPSGTSITTTYSQDEIFHHLPLKVEVKRVSDGHILRETEYKYGIRIYDDHGSIIVEDNLIEETDDYSAYAKNVKFIFKTHVYTKVFDNSLTPEIYHTEYAEYDEYGNVINVINRGNENNPDDSSESITTYNVNENDWVFAPKKIQMYARNLDGQLTLSSETRFEYDNIPYTEGVYDQITKGLVTKVTAENGENDRSVSFEYDLAGNLIKSHDAKQTETPGTGNTITLTYDPVFHACLTNTSNSAGHSGSITYDDLMRPISTTDANGIVSTVKYDELGRVIATALPGDDVDSDPTSTTEYHISGAFASDPAGTPGYVKTTAGTIVSYQYFDALGRTMQSKSIAPGNQWRTIDYFYDNAGRLYKQSVPYFTGGSEYSEPDENQPVTEVEFDVLGRVVKSINTDSTFSEVIYDRRKITSIDTARHVTETEVTGNTTITRSYDQTYETYYPDYPYAVTTLKQGWNGTRITDNNGNIIETVNDMLGARLSYSDPDLGAWTYTYDTNMNVATQTDAIGQVVSFDYDILNRPTAEYHDGVLAARYLYDGKDEDGNEDIVAHGAYARGRLTKVLYGENCESYKYDHQGRIIEIKITIDGITKTQGFSYDKLGSVVTQELPEGTDGEGGRELLSYAYKVDGNAESLTGKNGIAYASDLMFTAYGKMEQIMYGNGDITTYDFYDTLAEIDPSNGNPLSFRLKNIHAENAGGTVIADTLYEYDSRDNIVKKSFSDSLFTYNETFTYDAFSRLLSADSPELYQHKSYEYDEINNIHEKAGLTYEYNANASGRYLAHGVSALKNTAGIPVAEFSYDNNGNLESESGIYKVSVSAKRASHDAPAQLIGDVDSNGQVDIVDSLLLAQYYVGLELGNFNNDVADVNFDNMIDIVDALLCAQYYVGLITEWPSGSATGEIPAVISDKAPEMELWINGIMRNKWVVRNTGYVNYEWKGYWDPDSTIDIVYIEDTGDGYARGDLFIDSVTVNGVTVQAEAAGTVFDRGPHYEGCFDNIDVLPGIERLSESGALRFTITGAEALTRVYGYNINNMITHIAEGPEVSTYEYNPAGQRIKKVENGKTTLYFYTNYEIEIQGAETTQIVNYYISGQHIAQRTITENSESVAYIHKDHLGSSVRLTNETGLIVQSIVYEPFGETVYSVGNQEPSRQFTGQIKDGTGLYYYNARYYNPALGRFTTPDTVLDGLNRYAYCRNNPVRYVDPTGFAAGDENHRSEYWAAFSDDYEVIEEWDDGWWFVYDKNKNEESLYKPEDFGQGSGSGDDTTSVAGLNITGKNGDGDGDGDLENILKKSVTKIESAINQSDDIFGFFEEFDAEYYLNYLDELLGTVGMSGCDAFVVSISTSAISKKFIGGGFGIEAVYTRGYGWSIFIQASVLIGGPPPSTSSSVEVGPIWGMNGDPANYSGFFGQGQFTFGPFSASGFIWFSGVRGFKVGGSNPFIGDSSLVSGAAGLQYYLRVWDCKKGAFPDIVNAFKAFEQSIDDTNEWLLRKFYEKQFGEKYPF